MYLNQFEKENSIMETRIIPKQDMNYLAQQSTGNMNMILAGMTSLLKENQNMISMLESQTWFQRMTRTITGKNKMTQQDIQRNHDQINLYMTEAMTELYEQNCIDRQIILSLGNQINELYTEHINLKQILGRFASKLNEKIESVDNFHMLITEIEQGVYSKHPSVLTVIYILSQIDKRTILDNRKMEILQRDIRKFNVLSDEQLTLSEYLLELLYIPIENIGEIVLELETISENYIAKLFLKTIEEYHFLSEIARKLKSKESIVEKIVKEENIELEITLSLKEIYQSFVDSKTEILKNQLEVEEGQKNSLIEENSDENQLKIAEELFLEHKLDEAYNIFCQLAETKNGRAMYFLGEYYDKGWGKVQQNKEYSKKWRAEGKKHGDILAELNDAFGITDVYTEKQMIKSLFAKILKLAEDGDIFAQNEVADLLLYGVGCEKDVYEGLEMLKKSANSGYWWAACKLGNLYRRGDVVPWNQDEAIKWYKKAAEKGEPNSKQYLISM